MKKKIFTLAIAAIAAIGFTSLAQVPQNKMYTPKTFTDYAFEGVLLELPQQQRIDSLHAAIRTPKMQKVHAMSMCPDSVKAMHQCQQGKQDKRGMRPGANMGGVIPGVEYVAKVKEILTPEQFDMFMSNIQSLPENVVNNLVPEMPQHMQRTDRPAKASRMGREKQCESGNCAEQQCKSGNCAEQQCNQGDCQKQNCQNAGGDCAKKNCKADKNHKDKKGDKDKKQKKSK